MAINQWQYTNGSITMVVILMTVLLWSSSKAEMGRCPLLFEPRIEWHGGKDPPLIWRGVMLFCVLSTAWPMALHFVVDPAVGFDKMLENDPCGLAFFIIWLPILTPTVILLLCDDRREAHAVKNRP